MIGTPIAFALTMVVCFTLLYYYWRIRQLRARLRLAAQNTTPPPPPHAFPDEFGIGKNVVETFPTVKACELKSTTASQDSQCPICLVEYEQWEVLRQLPLCRHVFHTVCVGAWFEKQTTCPVCRKSMSDITQDVETPPPSSSSIETIEVVIPDNSTPLPCPCSSSNEHHVVSVPCTCNSKPIKTLAPETQERSDSASSCSSSQGTPESADGAVTESSRSDNPKAMSEFSFEFQPLRETAL